MTFKELADEVAARPELQQYLVVVWPPDACPAAQAVPVTGIGTTPVQFPNTRNQTGGQPVLLTGKQPA
jgi:hypothetical protein